MLDDWLYWMNGCVGWLVVLNDWLCSMILVVLCSLLCWMIGCVG